MESSPVLPAEIWTQIFDYAADEDILFQPVLPTSMAESAWFRHFTGNWELRTPHAALAILHTRIRATKFAIITTCRSWRQIATQLFYRTLFLSHPSKLVPLCEALDESPALGWYTRRIHIDHSPYPPPESALAPVIMHCPNLALMLIDCPLGGDFGCVADTLAGRARASLHTLQCSLPCSELPKAIWALDSLPALVCVRITFEGGCSTEYDADTDENASEAGGTVSEAGSVALGAASGLALALPRLQQLALKGPCAEFVEQACGWTLPALQSLSIDCGAARTGVPDVPAFLRAQGHGLQLAFLDVYSIPPMDVCMILDLCPLLTTFAFNADWRIDIGDLGPGHGDAAPARLVRRPHTNLTTIGLHGLMYAFDLGGTSSNDSPSLAAVLTQQCNDANVAGITRSHFPHLARVRALSPTMLVELNHADGPGEGGYARWGAWFDRLDGIGVRLEDCTGDLLGNLPGAEEDGSDEEGDEYEEGEEEELLGVEVPLEGWVSSVSSGREAAGAHLSELRQLLEECRAMGEDREESVFGPMAAMFGGMGMR
ncbi:hypothetical protein BD779DRAFT_1646693 [Infundibulicybe gibba]|nr:hypothetical protein BD779DRAFT_1646693 [Infundibulicybe gibba]